MIAVFFAPMVIFHVHPNRKKNKGNDYFPGHLTLPVLCMSVLLQIRCGAHRESGIKGLSTCSIGEQRSLNFPLFIP